MPCYNPLKAYRSQSGSIEFREPRNCVETLTLPCGRCIGCKIERSKSWAIRQMHEVQSFKNNCFITLTYSPAFLPAGGTLLKSDFQKFMKRFRKRFSGVEPFTWNGSTSYPIRYYMCGEYGDKLGRPHYHACIFNFDFKDKYLWQKSPSGEKLYRSPSLEELWPYGHSSIGNVTFESAAYVARYIMKKITGNQAAAHYETVDDNGVVDYKLPEYNDMSRRPGIGLTWFEKYAQGDVYPNDYVIMRGKKVRPPRYYDLQLQKANPQLYEEIKHSRSQRALTNYLADPEKYLDQNNPKRLSVKEEIQLKKLELLKRKLT